MNRTEFLAVLSLRLQDLPADEREEAVKYYSEYLDEVGTDGEEAAIEELGGAEKVSNIIRANCGYTALPKQPAQAETAPEFAGVPKAPQPPVQEAKPASDGQTAVPQYGGARIDNRSRNLLVLLIVVLTFPVWIGVLGGLVGVIMGILGVLIAVVASGFGTVIAGIMAFFTAFGLLGTALPDALATMGLGLLVTALGAMLLALGAWAAAKGVPLLFKGVRWLINWVSGKVRGVR